MLLFVAAAQSNVVDDMVAANHLLYKEGEHPDHVVVIKYVPFVKVNIGALSVAAPRGWCWLVLLLCACVRGYASQLPEKQLWPSFV